jgi:hypothetical protein
VLDVALDKWITQGYIEPSRAWVTCNPLFVAKRDGSMRTCVDYRPINRVIDLWEWPLPKIKDIRHRLGGTKWYVRLDLKEAFHRISIPTATRPLTAFHSHRGKFHFTRMPFGLSTAPATYQRFIEWVLHDVASYVVAYVDDILIMGATRLQVMTRAARVRKTLAAHLVDVNEEKSTGPCQEVRFVGLTIKQGTIGTALELPSRPLPHTKEQWYSALGYANCFRDYLPAYADKASGLYPGQNQLPEPERQAKWLNLWTELHQAISLTHYHDEHDGHLFLDASKYAVGAVLTQRGKVCAIYSKSLNKSQQNYSATDREHLALMLGLEAFRVFVQSNRKITTCTDHSALLNRNEDRMTARQLRWKTRVLEITANIVHVPGATNPADFWSRQGWTWGGDRFQG